MGRQKCQDRADAFDVAGIYSVGKKVVGLAVLETGWCPLWHVGHESEQQGVGRWQRMAEEGSQRGPNTGACGGFVETMEGFESRVMAGKQCL